MGGALVALVTAGSEIGINTTSALRGVSDIGLGMSLGSNVIAIPLTVIVVYVATRKERLGEGGQESEEGGDRNLRPARPASRGASSAG